MTVAGLPGLPGGHLMAPALDMFISDSLAFPDVEVCGALIYRHLEPIIAADGSIEWQKEVDWIRLENKAADPAAGFQVNSQELEAHIQEELLTLGELALQYGASVERPDAPLAHTVLRSGFSPFIGILHSHPGGTEDPSHADFKVLEAASTWRRATAPQTLDGSPDDAQFYEADFIFALHADEGPGRGTLVHYRNGSKRGTWKGNFAGPID